MGTRARWEWLWGLAFAALWLIYWMIGVVAEFQGKDPAPIKAWTVLAAAVFVVLYLSSFVRLDYPRFLPPRLAAFFAMCAIAAGLSLYNFDQWGGAWIYCGVVAAWVLPTRRALLAIVAVAALGGAIALAGGVPISTWGWILPVVVLAGVTNVGVQRLVVLNRELTAAREEIARLAVTEERLRFARDLHDLLGHSLSVIVLKSELAGRLLGQAPERAEKEIEDVERVAREALREVRDTVAGYRQPGLDQELESARSTLTAAGMHLSHVFTAGPLPTPVDGTLAWAVREGVTNVIRHSGARRVTIRLYRQKDAVHLELDDDGDGAGSGPAGSGLSGLRERVEARDGNLEAGPRPDGGFRLAVRLPLKQAPQEVVAATT
jgi:two-component system sensor histidine kinase DesK